jgi:hypothetical protein
MRKSLRAMTRYTALALLGITGCGNFEGANPANGLQAQNTPARASSYRLKAVTGSHSITTQPLTNSILLAGYTDTAHVKIELLRVDRANVPIDFTKMVVIATATGQVDAAGSVGVNLKAGICFTSVTPTILPDDVIRVTLDNGTFDESKVAQVTCIRPRIDGSTLTVHGNANTGFFGDRLPLGQLEVQLISKSGFFEANGQTVIKAAIRGATGALSYDDVPVLPGDLTASFRGLSGPDMTRGLSADVRIVWLGPNPPAGNEATIFELLADPNAAVGILPGCFGGIVNAITTTDHPVITLANATTDIKFGGTAGPDISEVSISVNQGPAVKVVLPQTLLQKAWSLTVPAASVGVIPGGGPAAAAAGGAGGAGGGGGGAGNYTALATFTTPAGPPISLGAVAPALGFFHLVMPNALAGATIVSNPGGGSYAAPQNIELNLLPPGGQVFYTTDGTLPTVASTPYTGRPIQLKQSAKLQYFALLPDGTSTPVQSSSYTIGIPLFVVADPPQGTYFISQYINLSVRQPGSIFYTLDGSTPTNTSFFYDGTPVLINTNHATTALKYLAIDTTGKPTPVVTSLYTINDVIAPTAEAKPFQPLPAVTRIAPVVGPPTVKLFASEDATLFYTTDGSEPTTSSNVYNAGPGVVVTRAMLNAKNPAKVPAVTLKFMAVDLAGNQGPTVTALYKL